MTQLLSPFANSFPVLRNYFYLSGVKSPGVCRVEGAAIVRAWDIRKAPGFSGATISYFGDDLAEFDVVLTLWEPSHFDDFYNNLAPLIQTPPVGVRPSALEIDHPLLNGPPMWLRSVVVKRFSQFQRVGIPGDFKWEQKISFIQYRAPKPAISGKINQSIPVASKTQSAETSGNAIDRQDYQILLLNDGIKAAGGPDQGGVGG